MANIRVCNLPDCAELTGEENLLLDCSETQKATVNKLKEFILANLPVAQSHMYLHKITCTKQGGSQFNFYIPTGSADPLVVDGSMGMVLRADAIPVGATVMADGYAYSCDPSGLSGEYVQIPIMHATLLSVTDIGGGGSRYDNVFQFKYYYIYGNVGGTIEDSGTDGCNAGSFTAESITQMY